MNELERKRLATRAVLAELDECDREIRKIAHTALERTGQASSQPDTNEQTKGKSP